MTPNENKEFCNSVAWEDNSGSNNFEHILWIWQSPGAAKRLRLEEVKAGFAKAFDLGVSQLQDTLLKQLDNDFCKGIF